MESIAVYWEPVVRVYGFETIPDVSLLKIEYPQDRAGLWAERIKSLEDNTTRFLFTLLQLTSPTSATMNIVLTETLAAEFVKHLGKHAEQEPSTSINVHQPVDLLFFHGPHFQDRYGIAETAFGAIDLNRVSVHTIGCTGTSVYIVADGGQGPLVHKMLSDAFTVPKEHKEKKL